MEESTDLLTIGQLAHAVMPLTRTGLSARFGVGHRHPAGCLLVASSHAEHDQATAAVAVAATSWRTPTSFLVVGPKCRLPVEVFALTQTPV